MSLVPKIFTVFVWRLEGAARQVDMHYVAGMNSADAEERIKERNATHLGGQCFITTDEVEENYGDGCKLNANRWRSETTTEAEFRAWLRTATRPSWDAGQQQPAAFRRFHVANNRARLAAMQARAKQLASNA